MSFKTVDMVCVMATASSQEVIEDQIESLKWGLGCSKHIIIVDDGGLIQSNYEDTTVLIPKGTIHQAGKVGFKVNEGLSWAIENLQFRCAFVLDDDALILRQGLDSWIFNIFNDKTIGLAGVKDAALANLRYSTQGNKQKCLNLLKSFVEVGSDYQIPDEYVFYAAHFQSYDLVKKLYDLGLLSPDKEIWPLPCESYQTVVTNLVGYRIHFVGQYPYDLQFPLYVMHHGSVLPPDPRTIDKQFLIHHSIRKVPGVDEWVIREYYKKVRKFKWIL